jgi:hypothetical protein
LISLIVVAALQVSCCIFLRTLASGSEDLVQNINNSKCNVPAICFQNISPAPDVSPCWRPRLVPRLDVRSCTQHFCAQGVRCQPIPSKSFQHAFALLRPFCQRRTTQPWCRVQSKRDVAGRAIELWAVLRLLGAVGRAGNWSLS